MYNHVVGGDDLQLYQYNVSIGEKLLANQTMTSAARRGSVISLPTGVPSRVCHCLVAKLVT